MQVVLRPSSAHEINTAAVDNIKCVQIEKEKLFTFFLFISHNWKAVQINTSAEDAL